MNNELYYIRLNNIPVFSDRTKSLFDDLLINYIIKFKQMNLSKKSIINLIATSIDYPVDYINHVVNSYIKNDVLKEDLSINNKNKKFIKDTNTIKLYKDAINIIYNKKNNMIVDLSDKNIEIIDKYRKSEYKNNIDYNDFIELYKYIYNKKYFFDKETIDNDRCLISLTLKKVTPSNYMDLLGSVEVYKFDDAEKSFIGLTSIKKKDEIQKSEFEKTLDRYSLNSITKAIRDHGFYQYNLACHLVDESEKCDKLVGSLIDMAKESIFVITTKITNERTESYKSFEEKIEDRNVVKRFITGFNNGKDRTRLDITYDEENNYYGQDFTNFIHSKIIIVDNCFVALGSGNWFSSSRKKFEDSLIIFYCENALDKYNPLYFKKGDYYVIFKDIVENSSDLEGLINLYNLMKSDLRFNLSKVDKIDPDLDLVIRDRIQSVIINQFSKKMDLIVDFIANDKLNGDDFKVAILSNEKLSDSSKEKFNYLLSRRENLK